MTSTRSLRRFADRVPENTLLSHDLSKASTRGPALVTDIEVVDDIRRASWPTRSDNIA
jgi:hypothetical protein